MIESTGVPILVLPRLLYITMRVITDLSRSFRRASTICSINYSGKENASSSSNLQHLDLDRTEKLVRSNPTKSSPGHEQVNVLVD